MSYYIKQAPVQADPVYVAVPDSPDLHVMTQVDDTLGSTLNGCYKVRDTRGVLRVVKRYPQKDTGSARAWKCLGLQDVA